MPPKADPRPHKPPRRTPGQEQIAQPPRQRAFAEDYFERIAHALESIAGDLGVIASAFSVPMPDPTPNPPAGVQMADD